MHPSLIEEGTTTISRQIGTDGTGSLAKAGNHSNNSRMQHTTQRERDHRSHARQDKRARGQDVDDEAAQISPVRYLVNERLVLNDENTEDDRRANGEGSKERFSFRGLPLHESELYANRQR